MSHADHKNTECTKEHQPYNDELATVVGNAVFLGEDAVCKSQGFVDYIFILTKIPLGLQRMYSLLLSIRFGTAITIRNQNT